jgi:hypothetical protein
MAIQNAGASMLALKLRIASHGWPHVADNDPSRGYSSNSDGRLAATRSKSLTTEIGGPCFA